MILHRDTMTTFMFKTIYKSLPLLDVCDWRLPVNGTKEYVKGEILLNTINIISTVKSNNIIEIQAFPESNDILGLKDLYLNFSISSSSINMVKDVIASGDEISGVLFSKDYYTSSYLNGDLIRQ